jgi:fructose/tagatose bisphosphate aldolase
MSVCRLSELLGRARASAYAVGYFEAWDMYSLEAVALAAEAENAPVVLGFGGMMMDQPWLDRFGIEPMAGYLREVAARTRVPAATILNEVWEMDHAKRGVDAGFGTVMLNTCDLPYEENRDLTAELVAYAHARGVEVQAELGRLPNYGEDEKSALTDPGQAAAFVEATGVDFLAVSIGNVHLRTDGAATVDLDRLRAIRSAVDVPLVIHGGSGFPPDAIRGAIAEGVALFHVGSVMKRRCFEAARDALATAPAEPNFQQVVGSRKEQDFMVAARDAIGAAVRDGMRLYGASGKA